MGIDLGTDSIGWAVTDTDYNILKFKGNAMWGIRLLEGGQTADERRLYRSTRRRTQRDKYRISCLEELFNKEISKIDISFFQRLKESRLYDGDKSVAGKYSVFNDDNYKDIDYYSEYPTIYHLRKELIDNAEKHDVRLVYLALSHIIKNRGHFLFDSEDLGKNGNDDFKEIWDELNAYLMDNYEKELYCDKAEEIQSILKNNSLTVTKKKDALVKLFGLTKKYNPFEFAVVSLISGASVKAKDLFKTDEYDDSEAKSITFKNRYDEKVSIYEQTFAERFELIEKLKAIYDWAVLADILQDKTYISYAKVDTYEKHKSDLKLLKGFVKKNIPEKYNLIFNENKKEVSNYLSYSGHSKKSAVIKKCTQEDFCDFLKKQLPKDIPDEKYLQMYNEIAAGSFMPKIVSKDNSVIPMQLNRAELKMILSNAEKYCDFLLEKDESNKTVSEKIIDIFNFKIPYYVGPLNEHSDKHWLVRSNEKIYPWNFENIVDIDKSAEAFIENLTSKCTYLPKEDVLPKNSLLYSAFMVLNELNNLKIDGEVITVELKKNIFSNLFMKRNKVTSSVLKKYLKSNGYPDVEITGIDGDFKNSLKPFNDLSFLDLPESEKEEIIKAITIFGDDKRLLKKRLANRYGDKLSSDDILKISKLKYTGWGRLSKRLLTGIEAMLKNGTGEVTNIIRAMWETNDNLMELLGSKYDFSKRISEENEGLKFSTLKDEVDNLYVSPKIKRPIYQTMQIINEIVKIQGQAPKKIFIEVARFEAEKNRTISRKQRLLDLYKSCKKTQEELYSKLQSIDENEFRRDALYLYFTQFGKCMYTGQAISLEDIYKRNIYDIDHIFPRSKIKDDSLDNRVLVLKTANEKKNNIYPLTSDIQIKMIGFWKMLREKDLISQKKFDRLTRITPLNNEEISAFCNRQLVETRQSTKAIAQLLKKQFPETNVEYIKAGLVSDFRHNYDLVKSRDVNDYHHAKDAYLNIVVGNVYTVKARQSYFVDNIQNGTWSVNRMFDYSTNGAWIAENDKSLKTVKAVMAKNNIRFTRFSFKKKGGLFDQLPVKKGENLVPLKKGMDTKKYGGYNRPSSTYFVFIEYVDSKGKTIRSFEPVDLYAENEYLKNPQEFLKAKLDAQSVRIIVPCIKYNALISINGFRMHISSKSGGGVTLVCKPAVQLVVSQKQEKYIKKISNYLAKCNELKKEKEITSFDMLSEEENIDLYDVIAYKLNNTIFNAKFDKLANTLTEKRDLFISLSIYKQCYVLMQILNILHANVLTGDLEYIKEAKKSGAVTISNKLQPGYTSVKLINQSITGLYEQEVDLLK